jgi:hypothetical protein
MQHGFGHEGIDVLKLGVSMAFISVLLIYVIYGIAVGKGIGNNFYNTMAEAEINVNDAELQSLSYSNHEILPAAAVYSLTQYNSSEIYDVTCYICNNTHGKTTLISARPCLLDHLYGKVKLETEFDETLGQYHLFISPYSYTIKFDSDGGSGNMASEDFIYDNNNSNSIEGQALTKNTYFKQGSNFAGWSLTKGGSVAYTDGQIVKNLLLCGEMTLYAVWN